jgi:hypothetical protein
MARPGQQFSVFMLPHFLTAFFYDAAQRITSLNQVNILNKIVFIALFEKRCPVFFTLNLQSYALVEF